MAPRRGFVRLFLGKRLLQFRGFCPVISRKIFFPATSADKGPFRTRKSVGFHPEGKGIFCKTYSKMR
ncbi:MAG: hypothetical protein C6W57_05975 [Caldibacillus debilis]|nr:hypothetical protein [Bacillaceae bacterium]MBY6270866.1 hypothetical protein [Bacillaceae bacterium]REJ17121.1 MAG: hypothetical protein C6W57_05975 [Caldibacillus debilis]REJ30803.1 MAG: hypothetical protein C6W56_02365 [Caldibacillus debilis]